jgi:hypothetical protein
VANHKAGQRHSGAVSPARVTVLLSSMSGYAIGTWDILVGQAVH